MRTKALEYRLLQVVASRLPCWRNVWLSGSGFLCDAYDLFVIDLVLLILKRGPGSC